MTKKQKTLEVRGSKFEKICIVLQLIIMFLVIICDIYNNINNVESGLTAWMGEYGLWLVIILMFIQYILNGKPKK